MVVIPFSEFPAFTQEVTLDEVPYRFQFVWNFRGQYYTLSIFDRELNPIVQGIKVVVGYELISIYNGADVPPGELYVVDTTDEVERITQDDLINGVVQIVYIPEDEVAAL